MSKMATSLAEQLQRLKTPQTQLLIDRKKRPSILFDEKEAAEKDRETIFDIGYSGFQDLVKLNPSFLQFESSLFDKNARDLQRAVENKEVNEQLNDVLKKFMIHLSPYLLLQPSHKCLEWLIRRFNINDYNKDEMMMLILPYHESKIFVRCVQTMRFGSNDKWFWLKPIQENGVPLSKQALLNRTGSDSFLLSFICQSVIYAVDILQNRLNTLQVYYAFFCTSVIGALDVAKINESHITKTYEAIKKGLKSESIDFCAASLMIIGQMVNKTKLKQKILDKFVVQLVRNVGHPKLQPDIIILLVLIYRNQSDSIRELPSDVFPYILNSKWIPSVLAKNYSEGINILPFYLPLLSACLRNIQTKGTHWKAARKFCDILLSECFFKAEDADKVIRCTLESFIVADKSEDSIIEIESGGEDEDVDMSVKEDKQISVWYTNTLKSFEQRYSNTFDAIVKEIIRSDNKSMSELKKRSLKKVLSFLFSIVCTDDNVNLFEKLYHYNAQHRIEAVKYLVKNLEKLSFSDDSKNLLKNSIAERLGDDSPLVVNEALKFNTDVLLKFIDKNTLQKKLTHILEQTLEHQSAWENTGLAAIKHLLKLCTKKTAIDILIIVLPFLLQPSSLSIDYLHQILNSSLAGHVQFIRICRDAVKDCSDDKDACVSCILSKFETRKGLPHASQVLEHVKSIPAEEVTLSSSFYSMLLLAYSIDKKLGFETSLEILNVIKQNEAQYKMIYVKDSAKWTMHVAMGSYPINLNAACIKNIIEAVSFDEFKTKSIDFSTSSNSLASLQNIFNYFASAMIQHNSEKDKHELFQSGIQSLLKTVFSSPAKGVEFLTNYFIIDLLEKTSENAHPDSRLQLFVIKYFNTIVENDEVYANITIELVSFVRILSALRSPNTAIREAAIDTLVVLSNLKKSKYSTLISKLLKRQSEILMDENQLALIMFTIFKKQSSQDLNANMTEFIEFIATSSDNDFVVSLLLETLMHVNNEDILTSIASTAANILTKAKNEPESKATISLNAYQSIIVRNILSRYTHQTIKIIKKAPTVWQLLAKAAEMYKITLKSKSKQVSVTQILINSFDNELFNELTVQHQRQLLHSIVHSATYSENGDLYTAVHKFVKQIRINAKICVFLLEEMIKLQSAEMMEVDEVPSGRQRRNSLVAKEIAAASSEALRSKSWKCGITWLEFLQNKQDIPDAHLLISPLFAVLQKCLQFEDQSSVEYAKQLVLALIHHLCVLIAPDGQKTNLISEKTFKIEPVVKCIRGTQNPQTHHHALQLLSHSAKMLPDQVLHNMIDIFTFMGSSVVRHDDAYSFQIISNIIESIIPTLTKVNENKSEAARNKLVIPVLKVFSDIILDVPQHRRLLLYVKLLDTLDANEYLWMFLLILIESHVTHHTTETEKPSNRLLSLNIESPQRIGIASSLTKEFDCETIIITATKLVNFLQKLPINKPTNESEKPSADVLVLFNPDSCSKKQFRHFKYEIVKFINTLTSSVEFVNKVALLTDDETKSMKEKYQNAIISILTYIPIVSKAIEQGGEGAHSDYWKALLHNCFDILENVISLLSSNLLLVVVEGLLSHKLSSVRRRVIELLINKLQHSSEIFVDENIPQLVSLLAPLTKIIESIVDEKKQIQSASAIENTGIQQMALMAVKLLSKQLAEKNPKHFKHIAETLIDVLRKNEKVPRILLATILLSLCEVCSNLRVHSIPYFPGFMKIFIEIMKIQSVSQNVHSDNVLICLVTGLQKIVSTLALYLSPYLVELIVRLSLIWHNLEQESTKDMKRAATIIERLNGIWEKLATALEPRILIPTIDQSYRRLVNDEQSIAIGPVMKLLTRTIEHHPSSAISTFMPEITTFFISALQFRAEHNEIDMSSVNKIEDQIIKAFSSLTLKLSEGSFRPLYQRIYDWALKQNESDVDNQITYFRLSTEIAKSLKSLFVLFANDFISDASGLLKDSLESKSSERERTALLVQSVIETLFQVFLHDSRGFINGTRFDALLQPLVDQIENDIVLSSPALMDLVSMCLAQLGIAVNDDIQWKQLNYQILMKTRNNESHVRLFALRVCVALAAKLGEDYMPLLPETVPFISELLEDDNPEVEKQIQQQVQELEKILGEPLQKYF